VNLPNAITAARIAVAPLIALLPFFATPTARLAAFVLYVAAAVTDYWDGHLARTRNLVTDLGRLLDPLADKLLLVATFVPMYALQRGPLLAAYQGATPLGDLRFVTPFGFVGLPWWIVAVVVGREVVMTIFRQLAARRGVVISAIGPAKWKTAFQSIWVGASYFWFMTVAFVHANGWNNAAIRAFALFNGLVGAAALVGAVALTLYSLWLYFRRYGGVLRG
jgi:phosphatidylglycerophosphate synthase